MDEKSVKSVISQEDMVDCMDFVNDFSNELKKYPHRTTASDDETACARAIRNRLHDETDAKTRLEAFNAHPILGRGSFVLLGGWLAICYVLYFISFAGNRVVSMSLTLLTLFVFLLGSGIIVSLYFGKRTFCKLLPSKPCYNVVSECETDSDEKKRIFVICDNHDAMMGSPLKDFDMLRKLCIVVTPIVAIVFALFCILKMAMGIDGGNAVAKITAFAIVPTMFGVPGITLCIMHYSFSPRYAREANGIQTAVAMATYAYFVDNEMIGDGIKLVYASFGGEYSAHAGSHAFVSAHPELADATVLCIGDIQSGDFSVAEYDSIRKTEFSAEVVAQALASANEQGIGAKIMSHATIKDKFNALHGFTSNAFAEQGIKTATILAKNYSHLGNKASEEDIQNLFSLAVGTLQKLMKIAPKKDENTAQMRIVDVEGK